jgi:hypothetical protein
VPTAARNQSPTLSVGDNPVPSGVRVDFVRVTEIAIWGTGVTVQILG